MNDNDRKNKGLEQHFYILSIQRKDKNWDFELEGLTRTYKIKINSNKIECSCPDFKYHNNFCKHLYCIFLRITNNYSIILNHNIIHVIQNQQKIKLDDKEFETFDRTCLNTFLNYLSKLDQKNKDLDQHSSKKQKKSFGDCLICLEEIKELPDDQENNLIKDKTCHKYFHKVCLQNWFKINQTCPHCRSVMKYINFSENKSQNYDIWKKIKKENIKIDILSK